MTYRFIELCCGSASTTLHLLGAKRPLLPYQGSKWRFRHQLVDCFAEAGAKGQPDRVTLYDPGPWGLVARSVLDRPTRVEIIANLQGYAARDAREVYTSLHEHPVPDDPVLFSAQYLYLQRLAYSGKAVGVGKGRWKSPGFNTSSAYGLPSTERFGTVNPMVPSLVRVLQSYGDLGGVPVGGDQARAPAPNAPLGAPTLVYIDPPYQGSTLYPNGRLSRGEVARLATAWRDAGAAVFVSEAEALPELVAAGWSTRCLTTGRGDTSPFRGKQQEWLTWATGA